MADRPGGETDGNPCASSATKRTPVPGWPPAPRRLCGRADERTPRTTILGPSTRGSAEPPKAPPQCRQLVQPARPNFTRCAHEPIPPHRRCRPLALPGLRQRQPRLVATGIAENPAHPRRL